MYEHIRGSTPGVSCQILDEAFLAFCLQQKFYCVHSWSEPIEDQGIQGSFALSGQERA